MNINMKKKYREDFQKRPFWQNWIFVETRQMLKHRELWHKRLEFLGVQTVEVIFRSIEGGRPYCAWQSFPKCNRVVKWILNKI